VYNLKDRLSDLGKSQVWLLKQLRDDGVSIQPPQLSNIINGVYTYPKANIVMKKCDEIISRVEKTVTKC
jgi:hypothetical protein